MASAGEPPKGYIKGILDEMRELLHARRLLLVVELSSPEEDELKSSIYESGEERYPIEVIHHIVDVLGEEWIIERESRLSEDDLIALQEDILGED